MQDRFQLMNDLYELIVLDETNTKSPEPATTSQQHAAQVFEALKLIGVKLAASTGSNRHEQMLQLAKLYTAGLISFARDKGEDFTIKAIRDPDLDALAEYNEKLQR